MAQIAAAVGPAPDAPGTMAHFREASENGAWVAELDAGLTRMTIDWHTGPQPR